jgi:pilus assembly protein CpaC
MPLHNLLTVHEEIQQVWVDVCMLEISHSDGREVGLDWRIGLGSKDSGYESLPMSQGDSWQDSLGENPGNAFGLVVGPIWAEAHLLSLLRSGDARILASPSLLAENAQAAEFLAGGEIPIPTDLGIEWKPYGVGLKVKPTIQADGSIHLQVEPEVSSLDWENAVQLEDAVIPGIRTRRWRTQAAIKPGKALVIGGLLSEEESSRRKQVPLLGELPILGALFRSEVAAGQKTDLVVIVSPRLLQDDDPLWTDILPPQ